MAAAKRKKARTSYGRLFKVSAVAGAGTFLGVVPQLLVGICVFLGGLSLKNRAEDDGEKDWRHYAGFALMLLGCALGLGFGAGQLVANIAD